MKGISSLPRDQANRIISALRKGTPPEGATELFSVGREKLCSYFDNKLKEVKEYGISDVKFVSADWGQGKSHFLDLLRDIALKHNFVVSKVDLRSQSLPFDQLPLVIQGIMTKIVTPKVRENGLEALLDEWCESNKSNTDEEVFLSLKNLGIFPDMRLKLIEYFRHYHGSDYQGCSQVLRWFEGKETKSKTFKDIGEYIRSLVVLIRSLGYSGFVVMLDEAEAITSLSRISRRDLANENIRQIIDNDSNTEGFYFIFASTPTFLSGEDERGAQSYPALWRRISDPLPNFRIDSPEKVIVELPKLTAEEFFQISQKIKKIYEKSIGKEFKNVTDNDLRALAEYVRRRTDQRVGTMVRSTVAILDEAKSPNFDFSTSFEFLVEKAMEKESEERAK